jgi:2-polyprenyl-3-methyl-5-hydroxy-6-metoxy-1,4-benzoquinol methylase
MTLMRRTNLLPEPADTTLACYACGGSQLHKKFLVPLCDGPYKHDSNTKLRTIYECEACGQLSGNIYNRSQYADYYASLSDDYHYSHDRETSRYKQILPLLPKQRAIKVLDIGCGVGTFLTMLPAEADKFGIEPSQAAAEHARANGIKTIRYEDLAQSGLKNTFDLVTAIDVVEHMADLLELRRHLSNALRPGGTVIILTGDSESHSARFLGSYWSYVNYAEHITIFCPRSMRTWLQSDFSVIDLTKTDHHPFSGWEALSLLRVWLLFPIKWFFRKLVPIRLNMYAALSLPRDHMLVCATRNCPEQN